MIPLLLATSFTPEYARAKPYVESLQRHCNIPYQLLVIGRDMPSYGMPNSIVQAGHFLAHIQPCDIVIFTDADLRMHRPLDRGELDFLLALKDGQISACHNKGQWQPWNEEIPMLFPRKTLDGYDDVKVFNTGFVAAHFSTYLALFEQFKMLWPEFDAAYGHYAKVQLCMCAAACLLKLEWVPTPNQLCSHGHFACPEGVNPHVVPPTFNGRVIAFDHRLTH